MIAACSEVLKKKGKNEDAEKLIRRTKRAGLNVVINIIVGFPGENENDFKETMDFLRRNKDCIDMIANVGVCFIMSETELQKNHKKFGINLTRDWLMWKDRYNNYEIRSHKARRVLDLARELKIPVVVRNIYPKYLEGLRKC